MGAEARSAKQEALEAIAKLPEDVDLEDIVYRLYVLHRIHQGIEDVNAGRLIGSEELRREIEHW